jgi:hypothetical protein
MSSLGYLGNVEQLTNLEFGDLAEEHGFEANIRNLCPIVENPLLGVVLVFLVVGAHNQSISSAFKLSIGQVCLDFCAKIAQAPLRHLGNLSYIGPTTSPEVIWSRSISADHSAGLPFAM